MDINVAVTMQDTSDPDWRTFAIIGLILTFNTIYPQISFSGPWDSESFTIGVLGLIGLSLIYISWYRFTFNRKGLIPWMDNLVNPSKSSRIELLIGFIFIFFSRFCVPAARRSGFMELQKSPKMQADTVEVSAKLLLKNPVFLFNF